MARIDDATLVALVAGLAALPAERLEPDTPLISSGLLDSFAMLELVAALEQQGQLRIKPKDIHLRHLDSLALLRGFLAKLDAYAPA
ncbi:acyl carrier protein [Roseateles cavernae]|uniref:acyl carrier protein n=1 Tax=Roseateles cavernae TaxID=3153578 RepID=UPI0032E47AA1